MKAGVKAYKQANPDTEGRPSVAYPVTVEFEDGTQTSVDSREALKELKQTCSD